MTGYLGWFPYYGIGDSGPQNGTPCRWGWGALQNWGEGAFQVFIQKDQQRTEERRREFKYYASLP